jgi:hypothetical protein
MLPVSCWFLLPSERRRCIPPKCCRTSAELHSIASWKIIASSSQLKCNFHSVLLFAGKNVKSPQAEEIVYTIKERQYVEAIEKAYHFASITLLELLMQENDLMGRLRYVMHCISLKLN